MKKIVIMAGHVNAPHHLITNLKSNTGAPGEQEMTGRVTDRLAEVLRNKGFEVRQTDAIAYNDPVIRETDWDLFLAIHGDADVYGEGGGFTDVPAPHTDFAAEESARINKFFVDEYFKHSDIKYALGRQNKNTEYYYMWKYLSAKTPCVLIECGVVQDERDRVLLADTDRIANALARSICAAFDVSWDNGGETPDETCEEQRIALQKRVTSLESKLATLQKDCQERRTGMRNELDLIISKLQVLSL